MLNRVILMGRITRDLELKQTPSGVSALSFTIAVDRSYVKQGEERQADFISCVAWRQQAEFISRYFGKGRMIALEGQLRTRSYDDNSGVKHYVTEVYIDSVSFTGESKQVGQQQSQTASSQQEYGPEYEYHGQTKKDKRQQNTAPTMDYSDLEVLSDDGVPF